MALPFPVGYPLRALQISPTTRNARARLQEALPTWQVDGSKDLVTAGPGLDQFKAFRRRSPNSVRDSREVWALDAALLTPVLARHWREPIPVEWPDPFPLAGQLCPGRDWPYYSYAVVYADREAAWADLARWHDGVALVRALAESGPPRVRNAARALLDGDRATAAALARALEQADDPRAAEVRAWLEEDGPKRRGRARPPRTGG